MISLQTDDILFLTNKTFAIKEEEQLHKSNLLAKKRKKLGNKTIKFNDGCIKRKFDIIYLIQERQCKNLHLITLKSVDLISPKRKI